MSIMEFNLIRHAFKKEPMEKRSLGESGLTKKQQEKWLEAVARLKLDDPEITYKSLPLIEKMAEGIYETLPEKALVLFAATKYPRNKITADFLSAEISRLAIEKDDKEISTAFIWEPAEVAEKADSLTKIPVGTPEAIIENMKVILELDYKDDISLREYLEGRSGDVSHPLENELVMKAVNFDLRSENSFLRKRADLLKTQAEKLKETFKDHEGPVYFYGIGNHSGLIALDVAFNNRQSYRAVEEIPEPLALWKAKI
jgi:hypothetical protein